MTMFFAKIKKRLLPLALGFCCTVYFQPMIGDNGIPQLSDVLFSSREAHPGGVYDKLDAFPMIRGFHATRMIWHYIDGDAYSQKFLDRLKQMKMSYQGAVNTTIDNPNFSTSTDPNAFGLKLTIDLKPQTFVYKTRYMGCPASPIFQELFMKRIDEQLLYGVSSLQVDDCYFSHYANPPDNTYPNPYKCYCAFCMQKFREFLKTKTASQLTQAGVSDLSAFDYREYILSNKLDPMQIKTTLQLWFRDAALKNLTQFWDAMRAYVTKKAGFKLSMSANNYFWSPIAGPFDFGVSELSPEHAQPQTIYDSIQRNLNKFKRATVYTYEVTDVKAQRLVIPMVVASGGNIIVPWDMYIPNQSARYYGNPSDFADLFGLMRAEKNHLDGYKAFDIGGYKLKNPSQSTSYLQILGSTTVSVYTRVKSSTNDPFVMHLVDANSKPTPFTLKFKVPSYMPPERLYYTLTKALPYDAAMHEAAEESQNFDSIVERIRLKSWIQDGWIYVEVPSVNPWGILVASWR